ncbi:MAG: formimidoylglutamate deiminase [Nocardioidaceae bacterium]|nr:formimidoylglutamate deiminase [Nocardioidaceae bacterium]
MTSYWCERAWLGPGDIANGVIIEVEGSSISAVRRGEGAGDAHRLAGLTIPGFANCHSHAFHRALRGRTQRERGTFWTWRDTMYEVAGRLDPDSYHALALATYQEMALAGITAVGEFHYLHHDRDGTPYAEPHAMGEALIAAAREAGLRIALLDTCYLSSGFGRPPEGVQLRYSDGDADRWAERASGLKAPGPDVVIGAAIHSVRAVPRDQLSTVGEALPDSPLHVHLSEQVAENDACLEAYGVTPAALLGEAGVLSNRLTAVHATHLTAGDITLLGATGCHADFCATTERDLADGIGPARPLVDAGATLTLGTDSHAVVDMHEEMRAVELDERLHSQHRGHFTADELILAATLDGHRSLGFGEAHGIAVGAWADLVTLDLASPRTAGTGGGAEAAVFAATAADITSVVASGRWLDLDAARIGAQLGRAIDAVAGP